MDSRSRVLITGATGFTGRYITSLLTSQGYECSPLIADLLDADAISYDIKRLAPRYIVHCAAISFTQESDVSKIYAVNVLGTENLLRALTRLDDVPDKVILASSAAVYGNQCGLLSEVVTPQPVSHYACSKLCMEHIASNYSYELPIVIVRPFNYTGAGQAPHFVVPKIIRAVRKSKKNISLGNLDVIREFNDVRDIAWYYMSLLESDISSGVINLCTGRSVTLRHLLEVVEGVGNHRLAIQSVSHLMRENEIRELRGDPSHLIAQTGYVPKFSIEDTVRWMMESAATS